MTTEERIQALNKYEWTFNEWLRSSFCATATMGELIELNEHHKQLFGNYENLTCNDCRATLMTNLSKWYFNAKNTLANG